VEKAEGEIVITATFVREKSLNMLIKAQKRLDHQNCDYVILVLNSKEILRTIRILLRITG
tara:strand:+ start:1185 stop:1364 length:180 start_codon:yes stop_codon:yes gene_type:complete